MLGNLAFLCLAGHFLYQSLVCPILLSVLQDLVLHFINLLSLTRDLTALFSCTKAAFKGTEYRQAVFHSFKKQTFNILFFNQQRYLVAFHDDGYGTKGEVVFFL